MFWSQHLTADRLFHILTDIQCFDCNVPTENWMIIPNFIRQVMFLNIILAKFMWNDLSICDNSQMIQKLNCENEILILVSILTTNNFQILFTNHILMLNVLTDNSDRWFQIFNWRSCLISISLLIIDRWFQIFNDRWFQIFNWDKSCFDLYILTHNWSILTTDGFKFKWPFIFRLPYPYWDLTYDWKVTDRLVMFWSQHCSLQLSDDLSQPQHPY